ncbi:MAG: hypothetical protein HZB23_13270 [Deltaproteobacteria bacterium]|nr:hypothetical protein [Deltaproteobacteria bacterium]
MGIRIKARPFWVAMLLVASSLMVMAGSAFALTPAGTEIRNQSVATYSDSGGNPYSTSSNEVITIVDPIYVFEITPNATGGGAGAPGTFGGTAALTQYAAPGATVYYSYKITNNGNSPDSYLLSRMDGAADALNAVAGTVVIYRDANGNGTIDPGDFVLTSGATGMGIASWGGASIGPVAQDDYTYIIVAYQVPNSATDGQDIDLDIDGRSQGNNLVTDAVSNFNTTIVADAKGVLTLTKAVDKTDANQGDTLTYSITGSNTGNTVARSRDYGNRVDLNGDGALDVQNEGILISDALDTTRLTPGTGAANLLGVVSWAPNTATVVYSADGTNWYTAAGAAITIPAATITHVGLFIPDSVNQDGNINPVLAVGQGFGFSFTAPIVTPLNNTTILNNATVYYEDGANNRTTTSNTVSTDIGMDSNTLNYQPRIGPYNDYNATLVNTLVPDSPAVGSHPKIDDPLTEQIERLNRNGDISNTTTDAAAADRHAGQITYFVNTVRNLGGGVDTFNITLNTAALPAAYIVELMKSDGITALTDTNGDGIADTGPIAIAGEYDVVLKVTIPGTAATGGPYDIIVTATSLKDSTKSDTTTDRLSSVLSVSVDAAQWVAAEARGARTGDNDAEANDAPAVANVNPGSFWDFPLDVENRFPNGTETGARDTYDIEVVAATIPAGWTVTLYRDLNGNGVVDDAELNPIEDTGDLNPDAAAAGEGESAPILVRVQVPAGQLYTGAPESLTFRATSRLNSGVTDDVILQVLVNLVRGIKIEPNNSRVSVRGGIVTYAHQVTNVGNQPETITLSYASSLGWNNVFVTAGGANIGTTQTLAPLAPGASTEIYIKVFVPANAAVGSNDITTVTITSADLALTDSAVDQTTVIEGNLQLNKVVTELDGNAIPTRATQAPQAAGLSYHPLEYVTTYTNLGAETAFGTVLTDAIPAYTRLIVATTGGTLAVAPSQSAAGAITYSNDGGITFTYVPVAGADGADSTVTHIRYAVGAVVPGGTGTITFRVLIN